MLKYISVFIALTIVGYLYDKYKEKMSVNDETENELLIREYLLNDTYRPNNKPPLWIYIEHEYNSRDWASFGSRSSNKLNQPYLYLTVKSIINQGGDDFNVCIINDDSIHKLLPGWNINMEKLADPIKRHFRTLAMMKILYSYGGMVVPPSYLAMNPLYNIYELGLNKHDTFSVELPCKSIISNVKDVNSSIKFMGAKKESLVIKDIVNKLEELYSKDYTRASDFTGYIDRQLNEYVLNNKMTCINGKISGCIDEDDRTITINELLGTSYIDFDKTMNGIYLPQEDILNRTKYMWFARMSEEQIFASDVIICKYLLMGGK